MNYEEIDRQIEEIYEAYNHLSEDESLTVEIVLYKQRYYVNYKDFDPIQEEAIIQINPYYGEYVILPYEEIIDLRYHVE